MHDAVQPNTPRWGNQARDRKALAIWRTLEQHCGSTIADGAWLDVGCGSGGIASTLASKARHVTGVDPEPWEAWRETMALHPNLSLVTGVFDGDTPPVPDASIDVAVCNQVYEHVGNPVGLLRNIHRVLVPGGVCYFAGPNLLWPIEPHVFWPFVHWLPRAFALRSMAALGSRRHHELDAHSVTCWQLMSWFERCGFTAHNAIPDRALVTEADGVVSAIVRGMGRLPRVAHQFLLPVAPSFVFVLRKRY